MNTRKVQSGLLTLLLLLLVVSFVKGMREGINGRFTITSGGRQLNASNLYLTSTVGQPIVGTVSNSADDTVLCSGAMCGVLIPPAPPVTTNHPIHLPIIKK